MIKCCRGWNNSFKNFIDNIEQIKSYLDKEELFYEQLDFLNLVFNDLKECLKLIEKFEKIFFEKFISIELEIK